MDSAIEAKVKAYFSNHLKYTPIQVGTIFDRMDAVARMAGFEVDERFASAGLGAGPEAQIA